MANAPMEFDLVITNGKVVIPPDIISSSIGIKGEKIAAIGTDLSGCPAKKTIDAKGNYVLPGVVDPECHLGVHRSLEADFISETKAAIAGGVTGAAVIGLIDPPGRIGGGEGRLDGRRIDNLSPEVTGQIMQELVRSLARAEELSTERVELNRMKTELVQILAHELFTPITTIQGTAATHGGVGRTAERRGDARPGQRRGASGREAPPARREHRCGGLARARSDAADARGPDAVDRRRRARQARRRG